MLWRASTVGAGAQDTDVQDSSKPAVAVRDPRLIRCPLMAFSAMSGCAVSVIILGLIASILDLCTSDR